MNSRFLDVSDSVLNTSGEGVLRDGLCVLGGIDSSLGGFHNTCSLQSRDLNDLAAELTGKLVGVDLIAVLLARRPSC